MWKPLLDGIIDWYKNYSCAISLVRIYGVTHIEVPSDQIADRWLWIIEGFNYQFDWWLILYKGCNKYLLMINKLKNNYLIIWLLISLIWLSNEDWIIAN